MIEPLLWFLVSVISSIVHSCTGFGYGIIALALIRLFVADIPYLAAIISFVAMWVSFYNLISNGLNEVRWGILIPCVVSFCLVQPIAVGISLALDPKLVSGLLGCVFIFIALRSVFLKKELHIRARWYTGAVAGSFSGLLGGMFAISGPPIAIYFLASMDRKKEYFATISAHFVLTSAYSAVVRICMGVLDVSCLPDILYGVLGLLIGVSVGNKLSGRLNDAKFKKIVYLVIGITGAWYIIDFMVRGL